MSTTSDLYLMHHGIKGMRWGVRRFEDANGHLTPAGKRRYAIQDARKYYKINRLQRAREKTDNETVKKVLDGEIRRTKTRSDRKQALLSKKDIAIGREIVAKHRLNWAGANTAAKAALTAAGAYALYKNPNTRALVPVALAGGAALTYGSAKKIPYYFMENRRYKQGNEKGATKKGLTKKQQALRTAGKVAAGAALAGATGYALYKSGAGGAAINAGKNALEARTGIKFGKNSGKDFGEKVDTTDISKAKPKRTIRETFSNAKEDAKTKVKSKARSALRDRVMDGVDEDDPRTWVTAARNAKRAVSDIARYGRAINKARKGDAVGAVGDISDDLANATDKLIKKTQSRIDKAKSSQRNRKSKSK